MDTVTLGELSELADSIESLLLPTLTSGNNVDSDNSEESITDDFNGGDFPLEDSNQSEGRTLSQTLDALWSPNMQTPKERCNAALWVLQNAPQCRNAAFWAFEGFLSACFQSELRKLSKVEHHHTQASHHLTKGDLKLRGIVQCVLSQLDRFVACNSFWKSEIALWIFEMIVRFCSIANVSVLLDGGDSDIINCLFGYATEKCLYRLDESMSMSVMLKASVLCYPELRQLAIIASSSNIKDALNHIIKYRSDQGLMVLTFVLNHFLDKDDPEAIQWIQSLPRMVICRFDIHWILAMLHVFVNVKKSMGICLPLLTNENLISIAQQIDKDETSEADQEKIINLLLNLSTSFDGNAIPLINAMMNLAFGLIQPDDSNTDDPMEGNDDKKSCKSDEYPLKNKFVKRFLNNLLVEFECIICAQNIRSIEPSVVSNGFMQSLCYREKELFELLVATNASLKDYQHNSNLLDILHNKRRVLGKLSMLFAICNRNTTSLVIWMCNQRNFQSAAFLCSTLYKGFKISPIETTCHHLLEQCRFNDFISFYNACNKEITNCDLEEQRSCLLNIHLKVLRFVIDLLDESDNSITFNGILNMVNLLVEDLSSYKMQQFNREFESMSAEASVLLVIRFISLNTAREFDYETGVDSGFNLHTIVTKLCCTSFSRISFIQSVFALVFKITRPSLVINDKSSTFNGSDGGDEYPPIFQPQTNLNLSMRADECDQLYVISKRIAARCSLVDQPIILCILSTIVNDMDQQQKPNNFDDKIVPFFLKTLLCNVIPDARDRLLIGFFDSDTNQLVKRSSICFRIVRDVPMVIDLIEICLCRPRKPQTAYQSIAPIVYYLLVYLSSTLKSVPGNRLLSEFDSTIRDMVVRLATILLLCKAMPRPLGNACMVLPLLKTYDCHIILDSFLGYLKITHWPSARVSNPDHNNRLAGYHKYFWYIAVQSVSQIGSPLFQRLFFHHRETTAT